MARNRTQFSPRRQWEYQRGGNYHVSGWFRRNAANDETLQRAYADFTSCIRPQFAGQKRTVKALTILEGGGQTRGVFATVSETKMCGYARRPNDIFNYTRTYFEHNHIQTYTILTYMVFSIRVNNHSLTASSCSIYSTHFFHNYIAHMSFDCRLSILVVTYIYILWYF